MLPTKKRALIIALGSLIAVVTIGVTVALLLEDKIRILDQTTSAIVSDVTIYLTGNHWGGCFCMFRTGGEQKVGNVTAGPSQVAALSSTHALYFDPDVTWNGIPGDVYSHSVGPPVDMPIKVWTLSGGSTAPADVTFAQTTLTTFKTGINLVSRGVTTPTLQMTSVGCEDIGTLKNAGAFDATAVNVYYAETASCSGFACESLGGMSCFDRQVIFVFSIGANNVMLHELGHALLGPDHWPSSTVGLDNIMNDSSSSRTAISTGQAIFMNYDSNSVFNKLRGFAGIDCNARCPRIDLDESWTDCVPPTAPPPPVISPVEQWFACIECRQGEFERLIPNPNDKIAGDKTVELLNQPLTPAGADDTHVRAADDVHRVNVLAGRQRRGIIALTVLAVHGNAEARRAIMEAYAKRSQYRGDVTRALVRAYQTLQPR